MSEPLTDEHWLKFGNERWIVGCQCGFVASEDDCGWGDSVVGHIAAAVRADERAKVLAEVEAQAVGIGEVADLLRRLGLTRLPGRALTEPTS